MLYICYVYKNTQTIITAIHLNFTFFKYILARVV